MEAIISIEIGMSTIRTDIPEQSNIESVIKDLDIVNKLREAVVVRIASYHHRLAKPIQQTRETPNVSADLSAEKF